jgi:hypothetical protein
LTDGREAQRLRQAYSGDENARCTKPLRDSFVVPFSSV